MANNGFRTQVHSPAPRFVGETSLALIPEGDRAALYEAMRRQLLPVPEASEFTVALPGFVPTTVEFKSLRTAAMAMLSRARRRARARPRGRGIHLRGHEQGR